MPSEAKGVATPAATYGSELHDLDTLLGELIRMQQDGGGGKSLQPLAAMTLMTLLHLARFARSDLLRAIQFLAKRITRRDNMCAKRIGKVINNAWSSKDYMMVGWLETRSTDSPSTCSVKRTLRGVLLP